MTELDYLLARAERVVPAPSQLQAQALIRDLAAALRAQTDDTCRLKAELAEAQNDGTHWFDRFTQADNERADWKRWCEERETELAEARAAAPQPLWTGQTSELTTRSKTASLAVYPPRLEVPPRTKIALYRGDQAPPGVTRDQVHAALIEVARQHGVGGTFIAAMADAVWALLAGEGST